MNNVQTANTLSIFSQEVQILSPPSQYGDYLLGAYYYRQHFPREENLSGGVDASGALGNTQIKSTSDIENAALFAHINYDITSKLSVFGGFRLLTENIHVVGQQQGDFWLWPTDYPENEVRANDRDYVSVAGLQYFPISDSQLYATIRRGYKGKAVDNPANGLFFRAPQSLADGTLLTVDDSVLDPETVKLYEIGSKNVFSARRILINGAIYYSEFKNFQTSSFDGSAVSFRLTNAGIIDLRGMELELQLRPSPNTFFSTALAWNDATYKSFRNGPCQVSQVVQGSCTNSTQNLSGKGLNENPKWQYFVQYRQETRLPFGVAYIDARYAWRDTIIFDGDLDQNTQQEAFGLLDLRFGLRYGDLDIALFINNATDENYANRIIDAPIWQGAYQRYPGEARRLGFELSIYHK